MTKLFLMLGGSLAFAFGWPIPASAQQVITVCGASAGKAFDLEPKKDGWADDGMRGSITFIQYQSGDYDIVIKSVYKTFTARGDGAKVVKVHGVDDNVATFVVVYPLHVTEVCQLTLNATGRGTLIWASLKNRVGSSGTRGAVFTAACDR